jgi:hypothetical protein
MSLGGNPIIALEGADYFSILWHTLTSLRAMPNCN